MTFKNTTIEGCCVLFANVKNPVLNKFGDKQEMEYNITVAIPAAVQKAFFKEYSRRSPKLVENSEFVEKFKIDVPFPEQAVQYVASFKISATKKDGSPWKDSMIPAVYAETPDGKFHDITEKANLGRGSIVDLRIVAWDSEANPGVFFPKLNKVLVRKLVQYRSNNQGSSWEDNLVKDAESDLDALIHALEGDANQDEDVETASIGSSETPAEESKAEAKVEKEPTKPAANRAASPTGGVDKSDLPF